MTLFAWLGQLTSRDGRSFIVLCLLNRVLPCILQVCSRLCVRWRRCSAASWTSRGGSGTAGSCRTTRRRTRASRARRTGRPYPYPSPRYVAYLSRTPTQGTSHTHNPCPRYLPYLYPWYDFRLHGSKRSGLQESHCRCSHHQPPTTCPSNNNHVLIK